MAEPTPTPDIYHVIRIAGDPQEGLNFWVEALGLRLAKRSINRDGPSTHHFFFAGTAGTPDTSATFFPWENLSRGKVDTKQVSRTVFRVPEGDLDCWEDRFDECGVDYGDRVERFGETVPPFSGPDGLPVELVEVEAPNDGPTVPWTEFAPGDAAIHDFHSMMLWPADLQPTEDLLETMGFECAGAEEVRNDTSGDERTRFATTGSAEEYADVLPAIENGRQGLGTVHHVTLQTLTDEDQEAMRKAAQPKGLRPTAQISRHWLRPVYLRGFGDVLFGLATDNPGYTTDEPLDDLGGRLALSGEFEDRCKQIEVGLIDAVAPRTESTGAGD